MARLTRRVQNIDCFDSNDDPNKLPIVSGKGEYGGQSPVITAVLIDGDRAWFDEAATHGRTALEQEISWMSSPEEVENGRTIDIVWLYIKPNKGEYVYHGATASNMIIDEEAGKGYKYLADHANQLAKAVKGGVDLSLLSQDSKRKLIDALNTYPDVLQNSSEELKEALELSTAVE